MSREVHQPFRAVIGRHGQQIILGAGHTNAQARPATNMPGQVDRLPGRIQRLCPAIAVVDVGPVLIQHPERLAERAEQQRIIGIDQRLALVRIETAGEDAYREVLVVDHPHLIAQPQRHQIGLRHEEDLEDRRRQLDPAPLTRPQVHELDRRHLGRAHCQHRIVPRQLHHVRPHREVQRLDVLSADDVRHADEIAEAVGHEHIARRCVDGLHHALHGLMLIISPLRHRTGRHDPGGSGSWLRALLGGASWRRMVSRHGRFMAHTGFLGPGSQLRCQPQ